MDKHYLTPLFAPQSIAVFAGRSDDEASQTRQARQLHAALRAQRYAGELHFFDIATSGTLGDLAQDHASIEKQRATIISGLAAIDRLLPQLHTFSLAGGALELDRLLESGAGLGTDDVRRALEATA